MKIGIITDTFYPQLNGVTISVDNLTKELRNRGIEVYVFAPSIKNYKDKEKNIFRISSFKIISSVPELMAPVPIPQQSLEQIFRINFDLIHGHGNGAFSFLGYQVAKMKGIPFILTFHTQLTKYTHYIFNGKVIGPKAVSLGMRLFAEICDGIITPSEKMKKELINYGVKKEIKVIPSFIEYSRFQKNKKGYLHKRFGIPKSHKILLTVGRLGKEKNIPFLIVMFKKLLEIENNARFVITGYGTEREKLETLASKLGLSKRIHFTGKIEADSMPSLYADADVFVFASTTETQGLCILEAAASGLPMVVVKDSAYDNIVVNGETGFAVPLDEDVFAQKVADLLKNNNLRQDLGKNARKIARANFRNDKLTDELLGYYKKIVSEYRPKGKMLRKINRATLVPLFRATIAINRYLKS